MARPVFVKTCDHPYNGAKGGSMAYERRWRAGSSGFAGMFWFAGWLFTLAYAQLLWWQAILALVIWPYYLGIRLR